MHRYAAAGLEIESQLALPGLMASTRSGAVDVSVSVGEAPVALAEPLDAGPNWQRTGSTLLLAIPGLARFLVRDGREIVASPEVGVAAEDLAVFLAGPLLGICLHLRGATPLLASAVRVGGRAVLFCGESGAGKSTLAAALGQRGYPMIADDLCALDLTGAPTVSSDATTLKLWTQSVLQLAVEAGAPVRAALQKRHAQPPAGLATAAPIGAIYMLREARPPRMPGFERPNVTDTAIFVRRAAYRRGLAHTLDQRGAYLMAAARLADAAGVFLWRREPRLERMAMQLDELEAHWAELGLANEKAA